MCIPTGRDQPDNAARVAHRGAGLRLGKHARPSAIAAAITRVLADDSYRRAAIELGAALTTEANSERLLDELEAARTRSDHRTAS